MQAERTVRDLVAQTRAIQWWIDRQIERGRTDDEIAAELPLAAAFVIGEIGLADIVAARAVRENRPGSLDKQSVCADCGAPTTPGGSHDCPNPWYRQ